MTDLHCQQRHDAAHSAFNDIVWLLGGTMEERANKRRRDFQSNVPDSVEELDGVKLLELLKRNFNRLDPDNNGISRQELLSALADPKQFDVDEYAMLKLLAKYFDTIINLSDDEVADETVITIVDMRVLSQFLEHSQLKLSELHSWIALANGTATEKDIGPPPLSTRETT